MHLLLLFLLVSCAGIYAQGNRLAYLDAPSPDPYYVGPGFAKLTTPSWVGEEGVEAVAILSIDDMRDTAHYENYLRPIIERLKAIDGRAPVSIFTCQVDPKDMRLQKWLEEGLSIEVHTIAHPCPLLGAGGSLADARATVHNCIDLLAGRQTFLVRSDGPVTVGALIDLREVRLIPAGGKEPAEGFDWPAFSKLE